MSAKERCGHYTDLATYIGVNYWHLFIQKYAPKSYVDEMKGLSAGSGVDAEIVISLNMIPEVIQLACSMMGAWGDATKEYNGGSLVQLRALDFGANGPL
jgi:hypothetical protein